MDPELLIKNLWLSSWVFNRKLSRKKFSLRIVEFVKLCCSVVLPYLKKNVVEQDRNMKRIIKLYKTLHRKKTDMSYYIINVWLLKDR